MWNRIFSRTSRNAREMRRHVLRWLNEQRDILPESAVQAISASIAVLDEALESGSRDRIEADMTGLETVASEHLLAYSHPGVRENVKEIFVALTIILAFTSFFLQLTKIPTGSMQPTLFGITERDLRGEDIPMPGLLSRAVLFLTQGASFYEAVARTDGELRTIEGPRMVFPFIKKQRLLVGDEWYTIWLPPDKLAMRAGLQPGQLFRSGEAIVRMKVVSGDHLLVDRFTYNFRRPARGEIIVFKTRGIRDLDQDQLYIKRLVGLPGERVQIGNDQRLIIDGERLTDATPGFANLYRDAGAQHSEQRYLGHVNGLLARRMSAAFLAPLFPDERRVHQTGPNHYLAMGDNTLHSLDSRAWGDLPEQNVIGRCWFVYWPMTSRFGWRNR
jgi:signal peptidase I